MPSVLISFLLLSTLLYAAPALQIERTFKQPDGTSFQGKWMGDEYLNWVLTSDGAILTFNKKNQAFEYASIHDDTLKASGQQYRPSPPADGTKAVPTKCIGQKELKTLWKKRRAAEQARRVVKIR